jgi:uncharacterized protein involved in exopolysaccharide biosynthesis
MEEEIDLRKYVDVLLRHWKLILSITVTAVVVAVVVGFLSPPIYEAKASVLIATTRAEIIFEPKYRTFTLEEDKELRETLVALVKSSSVAAEAIERLGDELEPENQSIRNILSKVAVNTSGDLIDISVKSTDHEETAAIANAWAESYVSYVNGLYSDILQSPEKLQVQADAAERDYEERQRVWESFVGNNTIAELGRQITDKELLCNIKSLREQIESGSLSPASSAANSLTLVLLQARAFTTLPAQLQVALDELPGLDASTEELLHDIDALISTLESRTGGQPGQSISELRQEILQLRAERERERAKERELQTSRDIAWQTFETLNNKMAEVEVATRAQDVVVRVADPATAPEPTVAFPKVTNVVIALVLGLIVGVFGAFGVEYFRKPQEKPEVEKNEGIEEKPGVGNNEA